MRLFVCSFLALVAYGQTPLTAEEKLALENATLKLQLLEAQKDAVQKAAQATFEAICKRAGIEVAACRYDAKTQSVTKAEAAK